MNIKPGDFVGTFKYSSPDVARVDEGADDRVVPFVENGMSYFEYNQAYEQRVGNNPAYQPEPCDISYGMDRPKE